MSVSELRSEEHGSCVFVCVCVCGCWGNLRITIHLGLIFHIHLLQLLGQSLQLDHLILHPTKYTLLFVDFFGQIKVLVVELFDGFGVRGEGSPLGGLSCRLLAQVREGGLEGVDFGGVLFGLFATSDLGFADGLFDGSEVVQFGGRGERGDERVDVVVGQPGVVVWG